MNPDDVADLAREALVLVLLLSSPMLAAALLVGLLAGLAQALTQLQDQALSAVPKIVGVLAVFALCLPWMLERIMEYSHGLFQNIPQAVTGG